MKLESQGNKSCQQKSSRKLSIAVENYLIYNQNIPEGGVFLNL